MNLPMGDGARTTSACPFPTRTMSEGALHESSSVLMSVSGDADDTPARARVVNLSTGGPR